MSEWVKGKIVCKEIKGRKAYYFQYTRKSGKPGQIEFFPEVDQVMRIFESQPELEMMWQDSRHFTVKFEDKEITNRQLGDNHGLGEAAGSVKLPGERRLFPGKISQALKRLEESNQLYQINASLLLNKMIWKYDGKDFNIPPDGKSRFLSFFESMDFTESMRNFYKKMETLTQQIEIQHGSQNVNSFKMTLNPNSRLIVGIGNPSPAETGILLHHIYGLPYIPGSALKGVTRLAAILDIAQQIQKGDGFEDNRLYHCFDFLDEVIECPYSDETLKDIKELKKSSSPSQRYNIKFSDLLRILSQTARKKNKEKKKESGYGSYEDFIPTSEDIKSRLFLVREIFGSQSNVGSILFLDAYSVPEIKFKADIMNPHYPEYYEGGKNPKPPGDWQNPVPIPFLTVEKGTFCFTLVQTRKPDLNQDEKIDILAQTGQWLKKALEDFGVGAKTALGYGLFQADDTYHKEQI